MLDYRGTAIRALSMEARMTICNMSIEAGARAGMSLPTRPPTITLYGRPHAPEGADWDAAWQTGQLRTDDDAVFDAEVDLDADTLAPFVTWGTNPGQGCRCPRRCPPPRTSPTRTPGRRCDAPWSTWD